MNNKFNEIDPYYGKWKIIMYQDSGYEIPIIEGILIIDNNKYYIKDEDGCIIFVAPAGNVAFAINKDILES